MYYSIDASKVRSIVFPYLVVVILVVSMHVNGLAHTTTTYYVVLSIHQKWLSIIMLSYPNCNVTLPYSTSLVSRLYDSNGRSFGGWNRGWIYMGRWVSERGGDGGTELIVVICAIICPDCYVCIFYLFVSRIRRHVWFCNNRTPSDEVLSTNH